MGEEERGWDEPDYNFSCPKKEPLPLNQSEYETLLELLIKVATHSPSQKLITGYFEIQAQGRSENYHVVTQDLRLLEDNLFEIGSNLGNNTIAPSPEALPLSKDQLDMLVSLVGKVANAYPTNKAFSNLYTELETIITNKKAINSEGPNL